MNKINEFNYNVLVLITFSRQLEIILTITFNSIIIIINNNKLTIDNRI